MRVSTGNHRLVSPRRTIKPPERQWFRQRSGWIPASARMTKTWPRCAGLNRLLIAAVAVWTFGSAAAALASDEIGPSRPKKIVLIAGPKSHGPVGNGIHDYPWSVKLLKVMLDSSNVADRVRVEFHLGGWPRGEKTLADADTIVIISDGRDGPKFQEAPHFASPERTKLIQKQIDRGCGFVAIHFSTFAADRHADKILDWAGGYFDWETDGRRQWYSAIRTLRGEVQPAAPKHAILRGAARPFALRDEFYYNLRFETQKHPITPIWRVPKLGGRKPLGDVVAWARQRKGGGRGFATTAGHFYDNWKEAPFRTVIMNAIVWTAGLEPPAAGVQAKFFSRREITARLGERGKSPRSE